MKSPILSLRSIAVAGSALVLACLSTAGRAADVPPYLNIIVGGPVPSAAESAKQDVLALNTAMFSLYAESGHIVTQNILAQHPVILALFSGAGGRLLLYRPGLPRLEAPSVPEVYQLLKSVGHSTMVLSVLAGPHVDKPADRSWQASMAAFRARMQAAFDALPRTDMPEDWRANSAEILKNNLAFMDASLKANVVTYESLLSFTKLQRPLLKKNIAWAAHTQVDHWMGVLAEWKATLGADWDKTYAASNTIYVARQNNILYSVLAQFFGPDAINARLMLIETISFTTTPEEMLESLTRIVADRTVGGLFFGNTAVMDYELMGGDARDAIIAATAKRGMATVLPPLVPFGSRQWPSLVTPGTGPATLSQLP